MIAATPSLVQRQLVIEHLALDNATLREERDAYRVLAQQALHRIADLTQQCERLHSVNRALREELRGRVREVLCVDAFGELEVAS